MGRITRWTETGRQESDIERNYQRNILTLDKTPTVKQLVDGQMARVFADDRLRLFIRHQNNIFEISSTATAPITFSTIAAGSNYVGGNIGLNYDTDYFTVIDEAFTLNIPGTKNDTIRYNSADKLESSSLLLNDGIKSITSPKTIHGGSADHTGEINLLIDTDLIIYTLTEDVEINAIETESETGIADAGTDSSTLVDADLSSSVDHYYDGWVVTFGALTAIIDEYDGSTNTATLLTELAGFTESSNYTITASGTNNTAGHLLTIEFTEDEVGGHTVSFGDKFITWGSRTYDADEIFALIFIYDGSYWVEISGAGESLPAILENQTLRGNSSNEVEANNYLKIYEDGAEVTVSNTTGLDPRVPNVIYMNDVLPDATIYPNRTVAFANIPVSEWDVVAEQYGSESDIFDLIVYSDEVYGGSSPNGLLLHWLGAEWEVVATKYGTQTAIHALHEHEGVLYAASGPSGKILSWNDIDSWSLLNTDGDNPGGAILALVSRDITGVNTMYATAENGKLYGAAAYYLIEMATNYGDVTNIRTLLTHNDIIYGGGDGSSLVSSDGGEWTQAASLPVTLTSIYKICEHRGLMYVAGNDGNLYVYDDVDTLTSVAPQYGEEDTIRDMKSVDGKLYAVTSSTTTGGGKLLLWNDVDQWSEVLGTTDGHTLMHSVTSINGDILSGTGTDGLLFSSSGDIKSNRNIYIDIDGVWLPGIVIDPAQGLPLGNLYNTLYHDGESWIANNYLQINPSGIAIGGGGYANYGSVYGETGYGFRKSPTTDNMQYKDNNGTWLNFCNVAGADDTQVLFMNGVNIDGVPELVYDYTNNILKITDGGSEPTLSASLFDLYIGQTSDASDYAGMAIVGGATGHAWLAFGNTVVANRIYFDYDITNEKLYLKSGYGGNPIVVDNFNKRVGINNSSPTTDLDISGNILSSSNIRSSGGNVLSNGYFNFGATSGTTGYGISNQGAGNKLQFKHSGGSWFDMPAGSDTQIQYNNGGILGADSNLFFDALNGRLNTFALVSGVIYGSEASGGGLTLNSTAHATKGKIYFGSDYYDQVTRTLDISNIHVTNDVTIDDDLFVTDDARISGGLNVTEDLEVGSIGYGGYARGGQIHSEVSAGDGASQADSVGDYVNIYAIIEEVSSRTIGGYLMPYTGLNISHDDIVDVDLSIVGVRGIGHIFGGVEFYGTTKESIGGDFTAGVYATPCTINEVYGVRSQVYSMNWLAGVGSTYGDNALFYGKHWTVGSGTPITPRYGILLEEDTYNSVDGDFSIGGDLIVGDNKSLILGTGSDMEIYYDGTKGNIDTDIVAASDLTIDCGTAKTVVLEVPVYEDLNFDPTRSGGPVATRPDDITINNVIHKEFTSANNQFCGSVAELPHKYKLSSDLSPHAHIFLKGGESSGATGVTFTVYWELRQSTGVTSGSVSLSATSAQLAGASGGNSLIITGTAFSGSAELGGQLALVIARTAGDAGDVVVTTYGVHYPIDTMGSRQIAVK